MPTRYHTADGKAFYDFESAKRHENFTARERAFRGSLAAIVNENTSAKFPLDQNNLVDFLQTHALELWSTYETFGLSGE